MILKSKHVGKNASSGCLLKWHLDSCKFQQDTIAMLEQVATGEQAKSMQVTLDLSKDNCTLLQPLVSEAPCLCALDVIYGVMDSESNTLW